MDKRDWIRIDDYSIQDLQKMALAYKESQGDDTPLLWALEAAIKIASLQHVATKNALLAEIERRFDYNQMVQVGAIVNYLKTVNFKDCQ